MTYFGCNLLNLKKHIVGSIKATRAFHWLTLDHVGPCRRRENKGDAILVLGTIMALDHGIYISLASHSLLWSSCCFGSDVFRVFIVSEFVAGQPSANSREWGVILQANLWRVVVEDDGAEVSAVVVGDEVFGGVGALQASGSYALVLQESLVQCKQHLQGKERQSDGNGTVTLCIHKLGQGIYQEGEETVQARPAFLFKKYNVASIYNEPVIPDVSWDIL